MAKRVKSPLVEPVKRREWYRLYEEEGHSPTKIAKDSGYDVRTVKRSIELDRQERERKETRYLVLRNAIERHYADLCEFAQKLDSLLGNERNTLPTLKEDPLWLALHEHLPRSIIWKNLEKWEQLLNDIHELLRQIEKLLEEGTASRLKRRDSSDKAGLNKRIFNALISHIKEAAQAGPKELQSFDYGKIPESQDIKMKELIQEILKEVPSWKEYNQLHEQSAELRHVKKTLHDELLIIKMRRVVPSRCRYCPI
jgi:hypothetical protein